MTIRHLKIFVAVCEEGSITKAGQKLFMAQPTRARQWRARNRGERPASARH